MASRPLSYDSLKTVLQYMDANIRFHLSIYAPSLKSADRVTPLTIETLVFNRNAISINGKSWKLGICRQNLQGPTPNNIDFENSRGGVQHDLDRFGLEDLSTEDVVLAGDIRILPQEMAMGGDFYLRMRIKTHLEESLEKYENRLKTMEKGSKMHGRVENTIESYRTDLIPYRCWTSNTSSPYQCSIQLTYHSSKIEHVNYSKTLPEARKYLTTLFFGGRKCPVRVRILEIGHCLPVIRLPVNVTLDVSGLRIGGMSSFTLPALIPLLKKPAIDVLKIYCIEEDSLQVEMFNTAPSLIISKINSNWMYICQRLQNENVYLKTDCSELIDNYFGLMRYWVENGKKSGTCITFEISTTEKIEVIKDLIQAVFGGYTIPMRNGRRIVVSFGRRLLKFEFP